MSTLSSKKRASIPKFVFVLTSHFKFVDPDEGGLSNVLPYANIGSMKSWGMDGTLAYTHTFNKDMALTVRGNFT